MTTLLVDEWLTIPGRGTIALVLLPQDSVLQIGHPIMLEGKSFTLRAIETFVRPGFGRAPRVGLLVTPLPSSTFPSPH